MEVDNETTSCQVLPSYMMSVIHKQLYWHSNYWVAAVKSSRPQTHTVISLSQKYNLFSIKRYDLNIWTKLIAVYRTNTPWAIKKRATLLWTITSAFLDGFQHFVHQWKRNKYSTLWCTYLMVPCRLWRHNCVISQKKCLECLLCKWIMGLMLSFEDKIFIKNLWECKTFSARRMLRIYPNKNWKQWTLDDFLRRLCMTSSIERKAGSGHPRSCSFVCF